jgi:hypothetical protein
MPTLLISFKKSKKETELKNYALSKSCHSAWIKEAMQEKMDKELRVNIQPIDSEVNSGVPKFNEDIL